jgi:hypothetical protein
MIARFTAPSLMPIFAVPPGLCVTEPSVLQLSNVHASASSMVVSAPLLGLQHCPAGVVTVCAHTPIWHVSDVQALLSVVHAVPSGRTPLAGQLFEIPSHVSCKSHSLVAARQTIPDGTVGWVQVPA